MTGHCCRVFALAVVISVAGLATGCATSPDGLENDPFQPTNRGFHNINAGLDLIIKPVAQGYVAITPDGLRASISNFFDNAAYPNVILNDFLQGEFSKGFSDIGRFLVNSTIGIGGLFDPATGMGLVEHDEDLGQTFGVWGAGEGAYLELPFFGPSSIRDVGNIPLSAYTNLIFYVGEASITIPLGILSAIDTRAKLLDASKFVDESALDSYIFIREAYRQRRTHLIYDGDPPLEEFDESEY